MTSKQTIDLILVLLFVGSAVVGAVVKKFKAYQASQQAKNAQERRKDQMLRMGRADEPAPTALGPGGRVQEDDARKKLIELAQRRQAQLAEMARRAAAGGAGTGAQGGRPPVAMPQGPTAGPPGAKRTPTFSATPPAIQRTATPTRGGSGAFTSAEDGRRKAAEREAQATRSQRQAEAARQAKSRAEAKAKAAEQARVTAAQESSQAAAVAAGEITDAPTAEQQAAAAARRPNIAAAIAGLRMGPGATASNLERWRNAIMLSEVLGPPKGL